MISQVENKILNIDDENYIGILEISWGDKLIKENETCSMFEKKYVIYSIRVNCYIIFNELQMLNRKWNLYKRHEPKYVKSLYEIKNLPIFIVVMSITARLSSSSVSVIIIQLFTLKSRIQFTVSRKWFHNV